MLLENLNIAEIGVFVALVVGIVRLWSMPKRMDGLEQDHKAVMERIDGVNERIDGVNNRIDGIQGEVNKLYSLLPSLK